MSSPRRYRLGDFPVSSFQRSEIDNPPDRTIQDSGSTFPSRIHLSSLLMPRRHRPEFQMAKGKCQMCCEPQNPRFDLSSPSPNGAEGKAGGLRYKTRKPSPVPTSRDTLSQRERENHSFSPFSPTQRQLAKKMETSALSQGAQGERVSRLVGTGEGHNFVWGRASRAVALGHIMAALRGLAGAGADRLAHWC